MAARLLERDGELATIELLLDGARTGNGAVVLIEGPTGIGKTGLLHAVRDLAAGRPSLADEARRELEARMQRCLPNGPLPWLIGLGADAVAAELAAET